MPAKTKFEETLNDAQQQLAILPQRPAVTDKYLYLSVAKVWGGVEGRKGIDTVSAGNTFVPHPLDVLYVAFIRPGKELIVEDLRPNSISVDELSVIMQTVNSLSRITLNTHKAEF